MGEFGRSQEEKRVEKRPLSDLLLDVSMDMGWLRWGACTTSWITQPLIRRHSSS